MDRILAVDDDIALTEMLAEYLRPEGFRLEAVHDGEAGVARILEGGYALIILDLMLPGVGGFEVLRRVRQQSQVPVILLTARGATSDRILGLEIGADDYLPKPFDPRELVARVRSLLRRTRYSASPDSEFYQVGDIHIDNGRREARLGGTPVELTSAEFDLLRTLLVSAGKPVTRETLFQAVLDREFAAYDRSIDNLVSSLRRKLGPDPSGSERIKTVRNIGYIYAYSNEPARVAGD